VNARKLIAHCFCLNSDLMVQFFQLHQLWTLH
jgi:hypothetical protein